jgi:nitrite reductase/ring-hydroxylating ferredoxin subunit
MLKSMFGLCQSEDFNWAAVAPLPYLWPMSNMTRRGFLGSMAAVAASVVLPAAAQAATWYKIASTSYFKLNQPKIVYMKFYKSGRSEIVKYGNPYSVLRTAKGVYVFIPMCSNCGRLMAVKKTVLHCNICGSNFNPKTGGPITPSLAQRALRKVSTRVRSGAIQIVPFA